MSLRNRSWKRPQNWGTLGITGQADWNQIADNIEQFYRDMQTVKQINTDITVHASYQLFIKILEDHEKLTSAADMLYRVSQSPGGSKGLVGHSQGLLNEKDLP